MKTILNFPLKKIVFFSSVLALAGCVSVPGIAPAQKNAGLVSGPPVNDIITPFDNALTCLSGRVNPKLTFSVGAILDQTGKEQFTEGGSGKFVTQGAGDIVQSALFKAGLTVVNRRDPRVMETEVKWGLQSAKKVIASNFFITGSINSLDFIPGGGFDAKIGGIGPSYRQNRILVGLDLFMTDARTGRIVANVPIQKQIYASEFGFGIGRFIGETLVTIDAGWKEREALHFALRQMLNLGTFELLTQVMSPKNYVSCREQIDALHGYTENTPGALALKKYLEKNAAGTDMNPEPESEDVLNKTAPAAPVNGAHSGPVKTDDSAETYSLKPENGAEEVNTINEKTNEVMEGDFTSTTSEELSRKIIVTE